MNGETKAPAAASLSSSPTPMNGNGNGNDKSAATAAAAEEIVDLSTISWRFEAWLNSFPLNRQTVLDYFKHSQFYGRLCVRVPTCDRQ
jgi:hypothetical protein